jgi:hypothetical protein
MPKATLIDVVLLEQIGATDQVYGLREINEQLHVPITEEHVRAHLKFLLGERFIGLREEDTATDILDETFFITELGRTFRDSYIFG